MLRKLFVVFGILLTASFFALPAMAKVGAVQVDSTDSADCTDPHRQTNQLASLEDALVWLNISPNIAAGVTDDYTWTLSDKGKVICECTEDCFDFDVCPAPDDNYRSSTLENGEPVNGGTCDPLGSVTLNVFDENGDSVGGDSFRITGD